MTDDPDHLATPSDGVPRAGSGRGLVIPLPIVVPAKILHSIEGPFRRLRRGSRRRDL